MIFGEHQRSNFSRTELLRPICEPQVNLAHILLRNMANLTIFKI